MDELNAFPYLEAVIRETLRLHAPVSATVRIANKDDVIPLERPYVDTKGNVCDHIRCACPVLPWDGIELNVSAECRRGRASLSLS